MRGLTGRAAWKIFCAAPMLLCLVLLTVLLPFLAGFEGFVVTSGSMSPRIPKNSVIFVKKKAFSEIREGDVITYQVGERAVFVTHRVVEVNRSEKYFVTKGDANETEDGGKIYFSQVKGVVAGMVPWAGRWLLCLGSWQGKITLLILLAGLIGLSDFLGEYGDVLKKRFKKKKGDADKEYGLEKKKMDGNSGGAVPDGFCLGRDNGGIFK